MTPNDSTPLQQRRAGRQAAACSVPAPAQTQKTPTARPSIKCDPAPIVQVPPVFYVPTAPVVAPSLTRPSGVFVRLGNAQITVTCADVTDGPPIGASVTVPSSTFEQQIYFTDLADITTTQLIFIQGLTQSQRDAAAGMEAAGLVAAFRLTNAQADSLLAAMTEAAAALAASAHAAGLSTLDCYWHSQTVQASCPAGAIEASIPGGANNPVEVAGGAFRSKLSQADADEQATTQALQLLNCLYPNNAVTKTCGDAGFSADAHPSPDPVVGRVSSVTIPAGSILSDVSVEDADAQAAVQALGALNCFYTNGVVTLTCEPDANGVPPDQGPASADVATQQPGRQVTIPPGTVTSKVSQASADADALALARSLLFCAWGSDALTLSCPDEAAVENGVSISVPASVKSPNRTTILAAGLLVSSVSKADANAQALALANTQLDCLYCNRAVSPVCADALDGESLDKTAGIAADTYCAKTYAEAQALAISLAAIPISVGANPDTPGCRYGNKAVTAKCFAVAGDPAADNAKFIVPDITAPTLITRTEEVVISANTFIFALSDIPAGNRTAPQAYVDAFAKDLAKSMLFCVFGNARATDTSPCAGGYTKLQDGVVEANTMQSTVSQEAADALATTLAASLKVCANPDDLGGGGAGAPGDDGTCTSCTAFYA